MKLSCLVSLALYAAFVYGYYQWLGQTFESTELWVGSFVAGLIALGGLGALYNSFLTWRDASVLADALVDMPRRDGKRTAAAGSLEPLGQPLVAPFSGKECVLYEYDIAREVTTTKKGGGTQTSRTVDFAGIGKTECIIRSTSSRLRLIGFPDLDPIPDAYHDDEAGRARARQYVQFTAFEDASGFGVLSGARDMFSALTGSEEALRKDWRMIAVKDCPWLTAEAQPMGALPPAASTSEVLPAASFPPADGTYSAVPANDAADVPFSGNDVLGDEDVGDEDLDDDDFDDEEEGDGWKNSGGYWPQLSEKCLVPGQQVVAIGRYDEVRQGLVGGGAQTLKIYADDVPSVARKLGNAKWSYLIGGLITLAVVNAGVAGLIWIYRHNDDTQKNWRGELEQAVGSGDTKQIDKLLRRGMDVNAPLDSENRTLLMRAKDAGVARLLIERGADVNAADKDGNTPLMLAAREDRPEMVQLLIESGADLDRRNALWGTTALIDAINSENHACIELLRKAGATDDTVTAQSGAPITGEHEAVGICREYLAAVFAADAQRLGDLSTRELGAHFDDVDFAIWQESRPQMPRLASGFVRGDDATVVMTGPAPTGHDRTWAYQLRRQAGAWRVARERWVTE